MASLHTAPSFLYVLGSGMFRALRDPCDMSEIRVKERDSCDPSTVLEPVRSGFDCPGIHQLRTPPATNNLRRLFHGNVFSLLTMYCTMWLFWTQNEVVPLLTCASCRRLGNDGEPRYNSNVEVFTEIQHCQVVKFLTGPK